MFVYLITGIGDDSRKHYGLSFHSSCSDYIKTFKCMSSCKSIGFQIYRLDNNCKCTCHELKTSTILPFFKWGTNGTTRKRPRTYDPKLYHIIGTLSPATYEPLEDTTITEVVKITFPSSHDLSSTNANNNITVTDYGIGSGNETTTIIADEATEATVN